VARTWRFDVRMDRNYLLTGLLVCEKCGKRFIGASAQGNAYRCAYYVCFSRHRYGTQECDQDRLRADELEDRVVESLLSTLARRELLEEAVERWGEIVETNRPDRERELAAGRPESARRKGRWTATSRPSRRGGSRRRSAPAGSRSCRRGWPRSRPGAPNWQRRYRRVSRAFQTSVELAELVGDIERALGDGALPEWKAVMQAVVAEIRVRDRGHIQPVFRVPILGPPYGLVLSGGTEPLLVVEEIDSSLVRLSALPCYTTFPGLSRDQRGAVARAPLPLGGLLGGVFVRAMGTVWWKGQTNNRPCRASARRGSE
jgi:hypothetical protein